MALQSSARSSLPSAAVDLLPEIIDLRRRLHRHPELGLHLPRTQQAVLDHLADLDLEITTGASTTSVTAVLRGTGGSADSGDTDRPAVLLRADMDALPLQEQTGLDYASEIDGAMHACGHDLHTAMLVGAARLLTARRDELVGDVVLMFQPGEEGWDGAAHMINEGVLTAAGVKVGAAFAMHVQSNRNPAGRFTSRPGQFQASSSKMIVTVTGRGGHGSSPHRAVDPIVAAAEMITSLQTMITRRFDIFDPVVLTVGMIHGGTKSNIIPDEVEFQATIRTFSDASTDRVSRFVHDVCEGVAVQHGAVADVQFWVEYPSTHNDAASTEFARAVVTDLFGTDSYAELDHPGAGSEDFSRVLQEVPGCYLNLGACAQDDYQNAPANHSGLARFDESVMAKGMAVHTELALRSLQRIAAMRF